MKLRPVVPKARAGSALIIILAAVFLLTILVVAFLAQASLNRNIALTSQGQQAAEQLAATATQILIGDLLEEMRAGSDTVADASNGHRIFSPLNSATMMPSVVSNGGHPGLLKRSASGAAFWTGTNYPFPGPVRAAASNSTVTPSRNQRSIPISRWNMPFLTTTFTASLAPDWILVSRQGTFTNAASLPPLTALANASATNRDYVIGRFAYMIYDVGGLVDITVAGRHSQSDLSATQLARLGSPGTIDLTKVTGLSQAQVDQLVAWRNPATNGYSDYLTNSGVASGFLKVLPGNQTFLNRQDLIRFWKQTLGRSDAETMSDLRNLTVFSREINAPSWGPRQNLARIVHTRS